MTHCVTGLIGSARVAERIAGPAFTPSIAWLRCGLAMLPLPADGPTPIVLPRVSNGETFRHLTDDLVSSLVAKSGRDRFAYFETDYFGGAGGQGALVLSEGSVLYGPEWGEIGPINAALAMLGVVPTAGQDAFDTVGLGMFRWTEDWLGKKIHF